MNAAAQLRAALAVEAAKFARARPVWAITVLLTAGVVAVCVFTVRSAHGPDPVMAAKAGALVGDGGWEGLFTAAGTVVAVGGLLGCGTVAGWVFGREFGDATITGLWALPVSRTALAAAKLLILLAWSLATIVVLTLALLGAGLGLLGLGSTGPLAPAAKFALVAAASAALSLPCAWIATVGRGYLPAIGAVVAVVVTAQIAVMAGAGAWFPFAVPGMWASGTATPTLPQLLVTTAVPMLAAAVTVRTWRRMVLVR